jgi:hypothetical protein
MPSCRVIRMARFLLPVLVTMGMLLLVACSSDVVPDSSPTAFVVSATSVPTGTDTPDGKTPEASGTTVDELLASIEREIESIRGIDTPPPVEHNFFDQS